MALRVRKRLKPTQRENNLFFAAAVVGMTTGLFGNLVATLLVTVANPILLGFIASIIFVGVLIWFYRQIKPVVVKE